MNVVRTLIIMFLLALPAAGQAVWEVDGCVVDTLAFGTPGAYVARMTVEHTQVQVEILCSDGGLLGKVCHLLEVGDCAVFRGEFPAGDADEQALVLTELELHRLPVEAKPPPGCPEGEICDVPISHLRLR